MSLAAASTMWVTTASSLALVALVLGVGVAAAARLWWRRAAWELGGGAAELIGLVVDEGAGAAAEVVIEQEYEARDGFTRWRENARRQQVRTFVLLLDDGTRIAVEASDAVRVWWPLTAAAEPPRGGRSRVARVQAGDRVIVAGAARAGGGAGNPYRHDIERTTRSASWLTLVEPTQRASLRQNQSALARQARWTLAASALVAALLAWLTLGGAPAEGRLVAIERHGEPRAIALVGTPDGERRFGVWTDAVADVEGQQQPVALRRGPWPVAFRFGGSGLHLVAAFAAVFFALVVAVATWLAGSRARGHYWWERERLDEPATPRPPTS
jgi:hypothetical protein